MDFHVTNYLTDDELGSFNQMKRQITELHGEDEARDEPRILRFLRARDFEVDKAVTMLCNSIKWRQKHGINNLVQTYKPSEIFDKYYPSTNFGFSYEGDVVALTDFRRMDLIGFSKSVSKAEFMMHVLHEVEVFAELLEKKSEEEGRLYDTWIFIIDFDKMPLSQVTNKQAMELLLSLFPIYEANYPERLKTAYIINASLAFTITYSLVKSLLYEKTKNKIKVFGKTGWQEELLRVMDPGILPAYLGGTKTDPDGNPFCTTFVKLGSPIPQTYYSSKSAKSISTKPGVKKFTVSRLSRQTIRLEVPDPGSRIEWEFQTTNYNIGFGLRYSHSENNVSEDVIPVQKMDTRVFCETGMFFCEKPGTYFIIFDNSFSWLISKDLYVRVDIVKPNGHKVCVTSQKSEYGNLTQ